MLELWSNSLSIKEDRKLFNTTHNKQKSTLQLKEDRLIWLHMKITRGYCTMCFGEMESGNGQFVRCDCGESFLDATDSLVRMSGYTKLAQSKCDKCGDIGFETSKIKKGEVLISLCETCALDNYG